MKKKKACEICGANAGADGSCPNEVNHEGLDGKKKTTTRGENKKKGEPKNESDEAGEDEE